MNGVRRGGLRRFVWLASWAKSGNTWVRCLLANFMSESHEPVSINDILQKLPGNHANRRKDFDDFTGVLSSHCTDDEIDSLRPAAYRFMAAATVAEAKDGVPFSFHKTHDACMDTPSGEPLYPADVTAGALYLIRNPLDVAVSFAFHCGHEDMSEAVARLQDPATSLEGGTNPQLRSRMGNWSAHVESWSRAPFPVLVLRYEDLLADTQGRLLQIVRFLGLDGDDAESRIRYAVERAAFARLQEAEEREGFWERALNSRRFFRSGRAGDWRRYLTAEQARMLLDAHGPVMSAWGYDVEALLGELHDRPPPVADCGRRLARDP